MGYNKTESDNFIFPSKHLPNCFNNYSILEKYDLITNDYEDSSKMLLDNFDCKKNNKYIFDGLKNNLYGFIKGTEPIHFTISKPGGGNRIMSVSNPLILFPLHSFILENAKSIIDEQIEANDCFLPSSHFYLDDEKLIINYGYDDYDIETIPGHFVQNNINDNLYGKLKISNGKYYSLVVDISNFYNNIYTHMISWFPNNIINTNKLELLDVLNRTLNSNETKGIVTGPYTSSLFSEIILSKVDRDLIDYCKRNNITYKRYCDDYEFFSDSREKLLNDLLPFIEEKLSFYKLDINYNKVHISEFPFSEENFLIKDYVVNLKNRVENTSIDDITRIELIINSLNDLVKRKYYYCNYLLSTLCSVELKNMENPDVIIILLNYLFNNMLKNDLVSKKTVDLIIKLSMEFKLDFHNLIDKWIERRKSITTRINDNIDIWLAYLILYFDCNNELSDEYLIESLGKNVLMDILIFEYLKKNNKIIGFKKEVNEYLTFVKNELSKQYNSSNSYEAYYTKYWLLFYTNSVRWKIHEIDGFVSSIFSTYSIEHIKSLKNDKTKLKLNIFIKMYDNNIQLFDI